jgi:hypothetical protein
MVEKFYAYYKDKRVNAYKALKMRNRSEITTSPVEKAELFDSLNKNNRVPVKPVKNSNPRGLPYFAYYSGFSPKGNCLDGRESNETLAHAMFQDVFLNLSEFVILDGEDRVMVNIAGVTVDYKIWVNEKNYYLIDVMYRLKETKPYSYYYKWNGFLGLEVVVTTRVEKEKVDFLSLKSIQICSVTVPKVFMNELAPFDLKNGIKSMSEERYNEFLKKYSNLYQSKKFVVYSKLLGEVTTKSGWKEKYLQMKLYEEQEAEMLERIESAKRNLALLRETEQQIKGNVQFLEAEKQKYEDYLEKKESEIENLKSFEKKYNQLEKNIKTEIKEKERIREENEYIKNHLVGFIIQTIKKKFVK